ncbi:MAG: carbon-nitrogen hydrolase family protein [Raoultibacter sp.]
MTKDIINVAVITYEPIWGDKEKNLNRMKGYAECAARRGADLIVFPETALVGYDVDTDHKGKEQMHCRLAESVPGPSSQSLAQTAKDNNIYIVFGLSEKGDDGKIYNSAAVVGPKGVIGSYRKMHLPFAEAAWAQRGDTPFMFDTEWGKIGVGICYDTYVFSEIMRYYRAHGCRLYLNPCAVDTTVTAKNVRDAIEYQSANDALYIASSNCTGFYKSNDFIGGSNLIGPGKNVPEIHYYAGSAFGTPGSDEQELYIGTIDLSYVEKPFLAKQWSLDAPDFRPDVYIKMYQEIADLPQYRK